MTDYIVRIELHGPRADYQTLHVWMQQQKLKTHITGTNGATYTLPTAMYEITSARTTDDLRDWLVKNLPACGSSPEPWIFVVNAAAIAWRLGQPIRHAA